ncbi:hypothetical protein [Aurantiacibacter sp. MUD61]|uniref:hypothetical protein n=1 Tax=Aurantiacibacter sp. MUD61 TaxID=3009083 RepID=UPI0022F0BEE1|nr:hypothetical protein [Aurantiacibacter sp. MUD61]
MADIADQTSGEIASQQQSAETGAEAPAGPEPQMALGHVDPSSAESSGTSQRARTTSNIEIGDYEPETSPVSPVDETRIPLPVSDVEIVQ